VVCDLEVDTNHLIVGKTRCDALKGKVFSIGQEEEFAKIFLEWLSGEERPETPEEGRKRLVKELREAHPFFRKEGAVGKAWKDCQLPGYALAEHESLKARLLAYAIEQSKPKDPVPSPNGNEQVEPTF
jgi:hypothetical protein